MSIIIIPLCMYRYKKSPAQVMIRWSLQRGFICIPKSNNQQRITQNADVFDFNLSDEDMQKLVCVTFLCPELQSQTTCSA